MCLILAAYQSHPRYPLIIAANRDEFYLRPTKQAHFWEDKPNILAGRDLEKGGTWMGVTRKGYFAALTNYRDPTQSMQGKRSRGEIVTSALESEEGVKHYLTTLSSQDSQFPGFNLITGNLDELYYYSNIGKRIEMLTPGFYGLSNHLLNTEWPKVEKGKEELRDILKHEYSDEKLIASLFTLLQTSEPYPDKMLPQTGVPLEMERMLSPLFIQSPEYGTRSSTVLLMSKKEIILMERSFFAKQAVEKNFHLKL